MYTSLLLAIFISTTQCWCTESSVIEQKSGNQKMLERLQSLENVVQSLGNELKELKARCPKRNERRELPSEVIAFSARSDSQITHLGRYQTIPFSHVVENFGNGYNSADSIFTVPVNGTYVFTWTILTTDDRFIDTQLQKNGVVYGYSEADSGGSGDKSSATNIIVLRANKGDHVSIRHGTRGDNAVDGQYHSSTFSGWLLK